MRLLFLFDTRYLEVTLGFFTAPVFIVIMFQSYVMLMHFLFRKQTFCGIFLNGLVEMFVKCFLARLGVDVALFLAIFPFFCLFYCFEDLLLQHFSSIAFFIHRVFVAKD